MRIDIAVRFISVTVALMAVTAVARAHDGEDALARWYRSLRTAEGRSCCSMRDCHPAEAQLSNGTPVQIGGDIITKVDGKDVATSDDLATAVENHKPGDQVTLEVLSGKSKRDVKVTLGKRPASLDQTVPGG